MPTGYTSGLYDGDQSFRDFVYECSKAFFIAFRDYEGSEFLPRLAQWEKERRSSIKKNVEEFRADYTKFQKMTEPQALKLLFDVYAGSLDEFKRRNPKQEARWARFEKMHKKVQEMDVEGDELLSNLKKFMLEQLSHDLRPKNPADVYLKEPTPPTREHAVAFLRSERDYSLRRLNQYEEDLAEFEARAKKTKVSLKKLEKFLRE